jgi:predicted dehydrogenase
MFAAGAMLTAERARAQGPKLKACVIGDYKQGGYGHSLHKAWAARDDIEVVGLADPYDKSREKFGPEAKAQRLYADYKEMLEKEKPDLVAIGPRWTIHHREYLEACVAVGAHGLMEKPIAHDLVEADAMVKMVEDKNLKWAMAFNWRAAAIMPHAKKLLEQGIIGDLLEMRGRGKEDERAGGEDLLVLGIHIVDLMRFFAGKPQWCSADISVDGRAATLADAHDASEPIGPIMGDRVHATYGFDKSVIGYFASTKNDIGNCGRWGLDLFGTKGIISIRLEPEMHVSLLRDPAWSPSVRDRSWEPLPDAPVNEEKDPEVYRNAPIVHDLVAAIRENRVPQMSLQDGREALEMVTAPYAAYLAAGKVTLPLKDRTHPLKKV